MNIYDTANKLASEIKQSKELKFLSHPFDAASYLVDFYWPIVM